MHAQGFAIFFLLCLTGCSATPNKVRESPPRLFETTKSSESVVSCIIEKYDGMGMQKALEITPRGDGGKSVKVMVNPSTPTIRLLIDVAAVPGGAFTRSYENFAVAPFDREIIQACGTGKY